MTNNKRIGGNTRRKKGGSYAAFMSKMQGHLDRGIAEARKAAGKAKSAAASTAASVVSAVPQHHLEKLATHATNVKASLADLRGTAAEKAGEVHAQMVGHLNTLVGHAEKHFPSAVGQHFRKAQTLARMSNIMSRKGSFMSRKGGYGSNKKKPSGGTKTKKRGGNKTCGHTKNKRGGYRTKKRGGNKRCGHTKKRPHKKSGGTTRKRRGGNCRKCGN